MKDTEFPPLKKGDQGGFLGFLIYLKLLPLWLNG
jgi:hypothetical protein